MPKKGVFIIESVTFEDEEENQLEGEFISQMDTSVRFVPPISVL